MRHKQNEEGPTATALEFVCVSCRSNSLARILRLYYSYVWRREMMSVREGFSAWGQNPTARLGRRTSHDMRARTGQGREKN